MASLVEIQKLVEQIKADLPLLVQRSQVSPKQVVIVNGLSDLSERLGLLQAGEFRTGNGLEPGFGFSGVRIGYPAFVYNSETWNLVGVDNDVLQFGLRSSDGKVLVGEGVLVMDDNGITIIAPDVQIDKNAYKFRYDDAETGPLVGAWYTYKNGTILQSTLISGDGDGDIGGVTSARLTLAVDGIDTGDAGITIQAQSDVGISKIRLISNSTGRLVYMDADEIRLTEGLMRLTERTTSPATNPGSGNESNIYLKADKLVLQFNDGGTIRYKYLDLTGTGVTWVHTTSAP